MKKFIKFFGRLLVCLCLVSAFFLVGCGPKGGGAGQIPEGEVPEGEVPVDPIAKYTLTLAADNGVTFEAGAMTANLSYNDKLPTFVIQNKSREVVEFYNVAAPTQKWTTITFKMPKKDIEIAPVYKQIGQALTMPKVGKDGADNTSGQLGDKGSADMLENAAAAYPLPQTIFSGVEGFIKDENGLREKGAIITALKPTSTSVSNPNQVDAIPGITAGGSFFRVKTYLGTKGTDEGVKVATYTFWFNFENYDTETLNFQVIQIRGLVDMNPANGAAVSEMITLAPGKGKRISLTITFTETNDNALTIIRFKQSEKHTDLKLGMSISKVNPK